MLDSVSAKSPVQVSFQSCIYLYPHTVYARHLVVCVLVGIGLSNECSLTFPPLQKDPLVQPHKTSTQFCQFSVPTMVDCVGVPHISVTKSVIQKSQQLFNWGNASHIQHNERHVRNSDVSHQPGRGSCMGFKACVIQKLSPQQCSEHCIANKVKYKFFLCLELCCKACTGLGIVQHQFYYDFDAVPGMSPSYMFRCSSNISVKSDADLWTLSIGWQIIALLPKRISLSIFSCETVPHTNLFFLLTTPLCKLSRPSSRILTATGLRLFQWAECRGLPDHVWREEHLQRTRYMTAGLHLFGQQLGFFMSSIMGSVWT